MLDLKKCELCPKKCKVNRAKNIGFCKAKNKLKIALASVHMWEEPCISYKNGSGTIFFSYCNLRCVYCQNYDVSRGFGKEVSIKRFSEICLELQEKKVHNINLVTPTHYVPLIIKGINLAKDKGLNIPIIYNTSGYESIDTIKHLENIIDIYLTDLKYFDDCYALKYSNVTNYFSVATKAIDEMYKQVGNPVIKDNLMEKGIILQIQFFLLAYIDSLYLYKYYAYMSYINIQLFS